MAPLRTYKGRRKQSICVNSVYKESSFDRLLGLKKHDERNIFETSSDKDRASSHSKNGESPIQENSLSESSGFMRLTSPLFFNHKSKPRHFDKFVSSDDSFVSNGERKNNRRKKKTGSKNIKNKLKCKKPMKQISVLASTPKLNVHQQFSINNLHESPILIRNADPSMSNDGSISKLSDRSDISKLLNFPGGIKKNGRKENTRTEPIKNKCPSEMVEQRIFVLANTPKSNGTQPSSTNNLNESPVLLQNVSLDGSMSKLSDRRDTDLLSSSPSSVHSYSNSKENSFEERICKSSFKMNKLELNYDSDSKSKSVKEDTEMFKVDNRLTDSSVFGYNNSNINISELSECDFKGFDFSHRDYVNCKNKSTECGGHISESDLEFNEIDGQDYSRDIFSLNSYSRHFKHSRKLDGSRICHAFSCDSIGKSYLDTERKLKCAVSASQLDAANGSLSPNSFRGFSLSFKNLSGMEQELYKLENRQCNEAVDCAKKDLTFDYENESFKFDCPDWVQEQVLTKNETKFHNTAVSSNGVLSKSNSLNDLEKNVFKICSVLNRSTSQDFCNSRCSVFMTPVKSKTENDASNNTIARYIFVSTRKRDCRKDCLAENTRCSYKYKGEDSVIEKNCFVGISDALEKSEVSKETHDKPTCLLEKSLQIYSNPCGIDECVNRLHKTNSDEEILSDSNVSIQNKENLDTSRFNGDVYIASGRFTVSNREPGEHQSLISEAENLSTLHKSTLNFEEDDMYKLDKYNRPVVQMERSCDIKSACLNNVSLHIGERLVLPSGKKYRRSMMVLRQILNNDSMNNDKVKGYDSLLGSTVNLRAPGKLSFYKKVRRSLLPITEQMSLLDINNTTRESSILNFRETHSPKPVTLLQSSICIKSDLEEEYFGENYYKDAILKVCKQRDICSFEEIFESHFENCKKIGEGVFGEVFSFERESGLNVLKVIPIEGNTCVNGENQKCFEEIYSELIISHVLDKLRQGDKEFMTEGFIDLVKAWLVRGRYPDTLLELWHEFDNLKGSENDSPEIFLDDQLYLVLELGNAGTDLECYSFTNASQAVSVLKQVACSLAVAEAKHDFEHRDLHWGNVLVSKTLKSSISCILNGQTYDLKTEGVKATIIDYTLSSITTNGGSRVYNDIGMSPDIFTATGDYQFDIYRHMREDLGNNWKSFVPKTNVRWLHYLVTKLIKGVSYQRKTSKAHKYSMKLLKDIESWVLDCNSSVELVLRIM